MKECINRIEYIFKLLDIKREVKQHEFVTSVIDKIDFEAYEKNKSRTKIKEVKQYDNNDYTFNEIKLIQVPVEPSDFKYQESKTYCKHCGEII